MRLARQPWLRVALCFPLLLVRQISGALNCNKFVKYTSAFVCVRNWTRRLADNGNQKKKNCRPLGVISTGNSYVKFRIKINSLIWRLTTHRTFSSHASPMTQRLPNVRLAPWFEPCHYFPFWVVYHRGHSRYAAARHTCLVLTFNSIVESSAKCPVFPPGTPN